MLTGSRQTPANPPKRQACAARARPALRVTRAPLFHLAPPWNKEPRNQQMRSTMSRRLPIPAFLCATAMLSLARAAVADPALVVKPMAEKRQAAARGTAVLAGREFPHARPGAGGGGPDLPGDGSGGESLAVHPGRQGRLDSRRKQGRRDRARARGEGAGVSAAHQQCERATRRADARSYA